MLSILTYRPHHLSNSGDIYHSPKYVAELCGRVHTGTDGIILSPNYPNFYPNNLECKIMINLDQQTSPTISLFFARFELENSNNCVNDFD